MKKCVCVPVLPEQAPEDAVSIPHLHSSSLLVYGSYSHIEEAYLYLGVQVRERGFTPAGYLKTIALVAPYVGKEINPDMYCSQLVLPLKGNM